MFSEALDWFPYVVLVHTTSLVSKEVTKACV